MNKTVSVLLFFVFISVVSAFWYFGHYRPTEKKQQAVPVKIYKTTIPDPPRSKEPPRVTETPTPTETKRNETTATTIQSDRTGEGFGDNTLSASDPAAPPDAPAGVSTAPEQSAVSPQDHPPQEHNASAQSKQIFEDVDAALASAEKYMEEGAVAMAKMLMSQPVEQQRIMWKDMKETFFTAKNPDTQEPLLTPEQAEETWQNIVNIIKSTGYIPPEGVE